MEHVLPDRPLILMPEAIEHRVTIVAEMIPGSAPCWIWTRWSWHP
jgi:hypothetical protein